MHLLANVRSLLIAEMWRPRRSAQTKPRCLPILLRCLGPNLTLLLPFDILRETLPNLTQASLTCLVSLLVIGQISRRLSTAPRYLPSLDNKFFLLEQSARFI